MEIHDAKSLIYAINSLLSLAIIFRLSLEQTIVFYYYFWILFLASLSLSSAYSLFHTFKRSDSFLIILLLCFPIALFVPSLIQLEGPRNKVTFWIKFLNKLFSKPIWGFQCQFVDEEQYSLFRSLTLIISFFFKNLPELSIQLYYCYHYPFNNNIINYLLFISSFLTHLFIFYNLPDLFSLVSFHSTFTKLLKRSMYVEMTRLFFVILPSWIINGDDVLYYQHFLHFILFKLELPCTVLILILVLQLKMLNITSPEVKKIFQFYISFSFSDISCYLFVMIGLIFFPVTFFFMCILSESIFPIPETKRFHFQIEEILNKFTCHDDDYELRVLQFNYLISLCNSTKLDLENTIDFTFWKHSLRTIPFTSLPTDENHLILRFFPMLKPVRSIYGSNLQELFNKLKHDTNSQRILKITCLLNSIIVRILELFVLTFPLAFTVMFYFLPLVVLSNNSGNPSWLHSLIIIHYMFIFDFMKENPFKVIRWVYFRSNLETISCTFKHNEYLMFKIVKEICFVSRYRVRYKKTMDLLKETLEQKLFTDAVPRIFSYLSREEI